MAGRLTFIHLSDIHFIRGFSSESPYDLDEKVRDQIVADVATMRRSIAIAGNGDVTGILVTGDVAFAGKSEEYRTAVDWLNQVSRAADCDSSRVWVVPGNHDVDQSVLKQYDAIPRIHDDLRRTGDPDRALLAYLGTPDTGSLLFAPMQTYVDNLAARYGCLTGSRKPWWEDDVNLNDGSILRIRGLNSTLISGLKDDRNTAKMLLGSAQTELGHKDGVAFLVMCHHPTDWLVDQDNAHEALCAYASLQLFGHKHMQRVEQINQSLRICAGAVHPVRTEKQWTPQYNIISLHVSNTHQQRWLVVEVYQRVWSKTERRFVKVVTVDGAEPQVYSLRLSPWVPPAPIPESGEPRAPVTAVEDTMQESDDTKMRLGRKRLLYSFISLPYHTRKGIMERFGLVEANDNVLSDVDVFTACFERARQRDVLEKVWDAIEHEVSKKEYPI
jgi:predicted phosphodiesterase